MSLRSVNSWQNTPVKNGLLAWWIFSEIHAATCFSSGFLGDLLHWLSSQPTVREFNEWSLKRHLPITVERRKIIIINQRDYQIWSKMLRLCSSFVLGHGPSHSIAHLGSAQAIFLMLCNCFSASPDATRGCTVNHPSIVSFNQQWSRSATNAIGNRRTLMDIP